MPDDDYLSLLGRAKEKLPETIEKHERFTVPEADVFQEGKTTVVRNFGAIVDAGKCLGTACRRCEEVCPQHLFSYAKLY